MDRFDLLALLGLGLLAWGLWAIYEPLAPLVVGGLILFAVLQRAARQGRVSASEPNKDE